jgi:hypothetical protein
MDPWLAETLLDVVAAILLGVTALWILRGLFQAFGSGAARPGSLAERRPSPRSPPTPPAPAEFSAADRTGTPRR